MEKDLGFTGEMKFEVDFFITDVATEMSIKYRALKTDPVSLGSTKGVSNNKLDSVSESDSCGITSY